MDEEQDAELITNLKSFASGEVKKLNTKIANALLITIIKAIIIKDDLEETLNSTFNDNEHADDEDESDGDSDDEEDDEKPINENDATIIEIKNVDPGEGTSKQASTAGTKVPLITPKLDGKIVSNQKNVKKKKRWFDLQIF